MVSTYNRLDSRPLVAITYSGSRSVVAEGVGGVDGSALGTVRGGGVSKLHMLANVGGGQSRASRSIGALDVESAIAAHRDHSPLVAVLHPTPPGGQAPLVAAGDDRITHAHNGPAGRLDPHRRDFAGADAVDPGAVVEVENGLGVVGDHQ